MKTENDTGVSRALGRFVLNVSGDDLGYLRLVGAEPGSAGERRSGVMADPGLDGVTIVVDVGEARVLCGIEFDLTPTLRTRALLVKSDWSLLGRFASRVSVDGSLVEILFVGQASTTSSTAHSVTTQFVYTNATLALLAGADGRVVGLRVAQNKGSREA